MVEYDKGNNGRRLLVGYTEDRARKDAYNREKGIRRLEKAFHGGTPTKDNINKCGYNKFLKMEGDVKVSINYEKLEEDARWDGLKGYLTNTDITPRSRGGWLSRSCGLLTAGRDGCKPRKITGNNGRSIYKNLQKNKSKIEDVTFL